MAGKPTDLPTGEANPDVVRLVRLDRGWSKKELAEAAHVSAAHVTRVELGQRPLIGQNLLDYAHALECVPDLLTAAYVPTPSEGTHYRHQAAAAEWKRLQAWARANLIALRVGRVLAAVDFEPGLALPHLAPENYAAEEAELTVAQVLRRMWRLQGRIADMTALIEAAGVIVVPVSFSDAVVDAATIRGRAGHPPVIVINDELSAERYRLTLAHELGHLVMDSDESLESPQEIERRATAFASEFLAPWSEVADALERVSPRALHELDELRWVWGVSEASFVKRAYDRGLLTEHRYRTLFRLLNDSGRLHRDRGALAHEESTLLGRLSTTLTESGYLPTEIDEIWLADSSAGNQRICITEPVAGNTPRHLRLA